MELGELVELGPGELGLQPEVPGLEEQVGRLVELALEMALGVEVVVAPQLVLVERPVVEQE